MRGRQEAILFLRGRENDESVYTRRQKMGRMPREDTMKVLGKCDDREWCAPQSKSILFAAVLLAGILSVTTLA